MSQSLSDQINVIERLAGIGDDPLELQGLVDALATDRAAKGAKLIAEAKEVMGEDFEKHIPVSREYYRNQREQMKLEFERRRMELDLRRLEAQVTMDEEAAKSINANL